MKDALKNEVRAAYLLSEVGGLSEAERLRRQAQSLLQQELALILPQVPSQGSVVDLGCGSGTLAAAVAVARPDVKVLGCDADAMAVQEARRVYAGVPGLSFEVRPLQAGPLEGPGADLVMLRLVLMHQADALAALKACGAWLRPGGRLYVIEGDDRSIQAAPAGPWLDRILALMTQVQTRRGGDRRLGRDLGALLERAGFRLLGAAETGFDLGRLGPDMGGLFVPVVLFYLNAAVELGLVERAEVEGLRQHLEQGFQGGFQHASVPLYHAWAALET